MPRRRSTTGGATWVAAIAGSTGTSAGSVVGIADPEALGKAVATLLSDSQAWHDAQQAGIRRVETLYTQQQMFGSYRELYQGLLEGDI